MIFQLQHHLFAFVLLVFARALKLEGQSLNSRSQFFDFLGQFLDFLLIFLGRRRKIENLFPIVVNFTPQEKAP